MDECTGKGGKATLFGVGVGPGDPEDITLRALRIMRACPVILLPQAPPERCAAWRIALQACPELEAKRVVCAPIPMVRDAEQLVAAYDEAADCALDMLGQGLDVAFLTIGDPTVYSTFAPIAKRVAEKGGSVRWVGGVTSFCAAAAALGMPLAKGDENVSIFAGGAPAQDAAAGRPATEVYMKSGKALDGLVDWLKKRSRSERLQISAVSNCGYDDQRLYFHLEEIPASSPYMTVVIVKRCCSEDV